jgi:hypothetical protein
MKQVKIISKDNGIIVKNDQLNFQYYFGAEPISVPEDHAVYLISSNSRISLFEDKEEKKESKKQNKSKGEKQ